MTEGTTISIADAAAARDVIAVRLHRTPVMSATYLGNMIGARLFFKLEMFQKTGSFKPRGVLNNMHHLSDDEKRKGVISLSAGNHAQALAFRRPRSACPPQSLCHPTRCKARWTPPEATAAK